MLDWKKNVIYLIEKKFKQKIEAVGFVERWNVEAWKFDKNID